jgi:hypothetical protein
MPPPPSIDPELVWGIALRGIALVYLVAFWSLRREIIALCGRGGITPVASKLARMRQDMGLARCVVRHPSLFWFSCSDTMLRSAAIGGTVCAALAFAGVASREMLLAAWILYLSFDVAVGLTYPWESMLFEAGLLAVLLPPLETLPVVRMSASPDPVLMWAFHWLLFRVLFGFGKNKFTTHALRDPLYLRAFLISQPLPSPLGWRAWRLPRAVLIWSHGLLFVTEMVLPFCVFVAGWPRVVAALTFSGLMAAIQAMGNFGFFNMLVVALCITLLDPRPLSLSAIEATASSSQWPSLVVAAWLLVAGLFHLPFNTWVARGWVEWPAWAGLPRFWRGVLALLRAAMPWRTVHAYGVFPPQIGPPIKWIPVFEGTLDGVHWEPYEYRYMPSTPSSPPRFVAPHTPRLDHFALYEGCGIDATHLLGTIFSQGNAYDFAPSTPSDRLLQRLLEPDSAVLALFGRVPFAGATPVRVRGRLFAFTPTTPAERRRTGHYWHVGLVGEHAPERAADATVWQRAVPAPEQFHPDERWARRRVPRLKTLARASSLDEVRATLDDDATRAWQEFWDVVLPQVRSACDAGWEQVDDLGGRLVSRYGPVQIDAFDRIRGAVTTALLDRIEMRVMRPRADRIEPHSYFHLSLWAHTLLAGGGAHLARALGDVSVVTPGEVNAGAVVSRGLMVLTAFRRDLMILHARKQRLIAALQLAPTPPSKEVPGFLFVLPTLAAGLRDPAERLPALTMLPSGDWTYDGVPVVERRLAP